MSNIIKHKARQKVRTSLYFGFTIIENNMFFNGLKIIIHFFGPGSSHIIKNDEDQNDVYKVFFSYLLCCVAVASPV